MKNKKQTKAKQAVDAFRGVSSEKNKNKASENIIAIKEVMNP